MNDTASKQGVRNGKQRSRCNKMTHHRPHSNRILTKTPELTRIRVSAGDKPTQTTMVNPERSSFQPPEPSFTERSGTRPEILARLEEAVAAIQDSESFRRYLDIQARFHNYSFGNTLLIHLQRPDATQVAGFRAWRKLDRTVKRGEKGIAIVVPHVRRRQGDDGTDEEKRITGFGTGYVFDVQQTDGEPLPTIDVPVLDGEQGLELYDRLADLAAAEGVSLSCRPAEVMPGEVLGYYTPRERRIVVREAAPLQMVKTLAHELAHHYTGLTDASRSEHETAAESVAYIVCAHHGLDSGARSFPYVATWSQDPAVFKQMLGTIQRVSAQIIDALAQLPARVVDASSLPPPVLERAPPARSPRELAKAFIQPYVLRGDSSEQLAAGMMGSASADYHAQIGGYAVLPGHDTPADFQTVPLRRRELAITRIGGEACLHRFSLDELVAEIRQGIEQPRLF